MTTVLISAEELEADRTTIDGRKYRHLFRARRMAVDESLKCTDGNGRSRQARVSRVDSETAEIVMLGAPMKEETTGDVHLLVAAPRTERATWLVEKAAELGVGSLGWLMTQRTQHRMNARSLARQQRVAEAALEQSEGTHLLEVTGIHPWEELERLLGKSRLKRYLHPDRQTSATTGWRAVERPVVLVVGPEGGWESGELEQLESLGCSGVGLGRRILRVETAAVVGAALFLLGAEGGDAGV